MPLRHLWLADSGVTDLAPLEGMPLEYLSFPVDRVTNGLPVIRGMTALRGIASQSADRWALPPAEFWSRYDRGEFGATPAPRRVETSDPGKSSWLERGEALPAFRAESAR
jgi:hypothetical protein